MVRRTPKYNRILVVFTGGTIAMTVEESGALHPSASGEQIVQTIPELHALAECSFESVCNIDSSNMQPEIWSELAQRIHDHWDAYDGFVIVHGTDTMAYSASALSFALQGLGKPVVLTGAQKPITYPASDAIANLVNAVLVAQMDLAEVCIVFGSKILHGNRATKVSDTRLDAFVSPIAYPIGEIELGPVLRGSFRKRRPGKPALKKEFNNEIAVFQLFPGMNPLLVSDAVEQGRCQGIVLLGFGPGNIPNQTRSLTEVVQQATDRGIPVVVTTQCSNRSGDMRSYLVGYDALKAGALSGLDMTDEAAVTKFMWVLAQTTQPAAVAELMHRDLAGELTAR